MYRFFILLPLLLFGCKGSISKEGRVSKLFVSLELSNFQSADLIQGLDTLSSRAIESLPDGGAWIGGSHGYSGSFGFISDAPALKKIGNGGEQYRAIGSIENTSFLLNAGSPAHIIRYDNGAILHDTVFSDISDKAFYNTIKFFEDDKHGIVTGDPQNSCLSILLTHNGGDSWTTVPCAKLPSTVEGEANFAASNTCIDVVGSHAWIVTGGTKARVFHTPDYGETWEVFDTPITQGNQMTGIYSVDFWDENLGVIFGGDWNDKGINAANKAITKDGGKTWELLSDGEGPGYRSCVKFHPKGNGQVLIAVGSEGMDYSLDQGKTWTSFGEAGFYTFDFSTDGKTIYLTGGGKVAKADLVLN